MLGKSESANKALSYNSGTQGRQSLGPQLSSSSSNKSLRTSALLQQPQDKMPSKVPLIQASIKFGGNNTSLVGFTKPPPSQKDNSVPKSKPDLRTSKSPPTQRQSFGSNLSYAGGSKLRMSTSGSSNTNNQVLTKPSVNYAPTQKREIPKFLQMKQPSRPQLITRNHDDSVEIEIEFDEKDLQTIEISSTSTVQKPIDRRTDEEILGLDIINQPPKNAG